MLVTTTKLEVYSNMALFVRRGIGFSICLYFFNVHFQPISFTEANNSLNSLTFFLLDYCSKSKLLFAID